MIWKRKNSGVSVSLDDLENQPGAIGDRLRRAYSQTPVPPDLLARIDHAVVKERMSGVSPPARSVVPTVVFRPLMVAAAAALVAAIGLGIAHNAPAQVATPQSPAKSRSSQSFDNLFSNIADGTTVRAQAAYIPTGAVAVRYKINPSHALAQDVLRLRAVRVSHSGLTLGRVACPSNLPDRPQLRGETLCFSAPGPTSHGQPLRLRVFASGLRVIAAAGGTHLQRVAASLDNVSQKKILAYPDFAQGAPGAPAYARVPTVSVTVKVLPQLVVTQAEAVPNRPRRAHHK